MTAPWVAWQVSCSYPVRVKFSRVHELLTTWNFKHFRRFNAVLCVACSTVGQHAWSVRVACERNPHKTYPSFSVWSSPGVFSITNAVRLNKQAILTTVIEALPVKGFRNSTDMNYELGHRPTAYLNAFSFHSFDFRFVSNVTVKCYTLHVCTPCYIYKLHGSVHGRTFPHAERPIRPLEPLDLLPGGHRGSFLWGKPARTWS
jgi:hypothetical protein